MFERFKKSHRTDEGTNSVAMREREARADDAATDDREGAVAAGGTGTDTTHERFAREGEGLAPGESPGERDRSVVAGGGDQDLAASRSFEREDMARGGDRDADGVRDDAALDRDAARDDLDLGDRDREHHHTGAGTTAAAAGAGAAAGAAARGHDDDRDRDHRDFDRDRDDFDRDRDDFDRDRGDLHEREARGDGIAPGESAGERDRGMVAGFNEDRARDRDRDGDRGHGGRTAAAAVGGAAAGAAARGRTDRDPDLDRDRDLDGDRDRDFGRDDRTMVRDRDHAVERDGRATPVMGTDALETMRARQRDRFGGFQWGSDFFGWLCAIGLASLLTAILVGAGVSLGLSTTDATSAAANPDQAQTIGIGGGIALLVVLAIAWFCGGYVAGRMARFDGVRQGIGVWLWTLLAAVVVAVLAAVGGSEYDIFERLNLPRIAVGDSTLTAGGAIAGAAAIVVTLLAAVIGGKVGERYHKRVDRVATHEYVADR